MTAATIKKLITAASRLLRSTRVAGFNGRILKFRPPAPGVAAPREAISGWMTPFVNAVTTDAKAAPMTTAMARSTTLPRMMKSLKPLIICAAPGGVEDLPDAVSVVRPMFQGYGARRMDDETGRV